MRSHAVGPLVLNERIDHFIAPEGGKTPSMHFHMCRPFPDRGRRDQGLERLADARGEAGRRLSVRH